MSVCCSVARSTTPSTCDISRLDLARELTQDLQVVAEDLHGDVGARARQHVIDAMRDGLADRDVRARQQRHLLAQLLQHRLARAVLHREPHVDLRGFDALDVLVQLRSARSPGRRRHLRHAEQQPFERVAQRIRVGEARPGDGDGADGQRAFVELRQERPAEHRAMPTSAAMNSAAAVASTVRQYVSAWRQPALVDRLQPPRQPRLRSRGDQARVRQQPGTEHGRDGQRDHQRRGQRHDVPEPKRTQQPPLDAAQHEERQEHERDDHRREHDGVPDLRARADRPRRGRAAAQPPAAPRSRAVGAPRSRRR